MYARLKKELETANTLKSKCKDQLEKIQEKDEKLKADMKFELDTQTKIEKSLKDMERERNRALDDVNDIKRDLPGKQKDLEALRAKKEQAETEFREFSNKLKAQNDNLVKARNQIKKKLDPFTNEIADLNLQLREVQAQLETANQGDSDIQKELINLTEKIQILTRDQGDINRFITQLDTALEQIAIQKNDIKTNMDRFNRDEQNAIQEIRQVQDQINQLSHSNNKEQMQRGVVSELMRAQANGQLRGIRGRLGDMGAIDQRYDIAISTAAGFSMDNIVVETVNDAQNAIQFLKENRLDRQTFLPLEKMDQEHGNKSRAPFNCPPNSERLFDLIRFKNDQYRSSFYCAVKDCLVVQNMDIANRVAYGQQRFRVVTLDGKLIEQSGVQTGGGKVRTGAMSSKITQTQEVDQNEINRLRQRQMELNHAITNARTQKQSYDNEQRECHNDYTIASKTLIEKTVDKESNDKQIKEIQSKIQTYKNILETQDNTSKMKKAYEQQITSVTQQIKTKEQNSANFRTELAQIDEQIEKSGGQDFQKVKKHKMETEEQFKKLEKDVNTMENKLETRNTQVGKFEEDNKNLKEKLEKSLLKTQNMSKQFRDNEDEAMDYMEVFFSKRKK